MAQITINGETYEIPESFTLGEMRIVERYADGHLGDDGYDLSKICGAIHVAIKRVKPAVPFEEIQAVVDELDAGELGKLTGGQSPPAGNSSEPSEPSTEGSGPSLAVAPENGNPSPTGSPDLAAGFRSFHGISTTSHRAS